MAYFFLDYIPLNRKILASAFGLTVKHSGAADEYVLEATRNGVSHFMKLDKLTTRSANLAIQKIYIIIADSARS